MAIVYRTADLSDVPAMAEIRAAEWGEPSYWEKRLRGYMAGTHNPQKALAPRTALLGVDGERVAGFIAGHRTRRYACDGELQWINVGEAWRRSGIAGELLRRLAVWFAEQQAHRVCVDVDPENLAGRAFYTKHGAVPLNPHWLVWNDIAGLAARYTRER